MLCLDRRRGQKLIIGDGSIVVTVLRLHGGKVRLGIEAPRDVTVLREELVGREPREEAPAPPVPNHPRG